MFLKVVSFYLDCFRRAFRGKFWSVEKWTGGIGLVGLIVTRFSPVPRLWEQLINVDLPFYFFLAMFLGTVAAHMIVAPYLMYSEERSSSGFTAQPPRA